MELALITDATTDWLAQPHDRTWATHLTSLESAMASARAALQDTSPDAEVVLNEHAFATTAPVGPLGPADAERIPLVLRDLHKLVGELEAARSRVARELRLHRRLAAARPQETGALYLDGRC